MSQDAPKNIIPQEEKKPESYSDWAGRKYGEQKESWMPWVEDAYLRWFGNDNKASYAAKGQLDKTKVTGIDQVDKLQDGVNDLAAGQVGKGGLLQPIGDLVSKEGINRAERQGKDDSGSYAPGKLGDVANPVAENAQKAGSGITEGAKGAGNSVASGAKGAGGYVSGIWGGKKEEKK